MVSHSSSVQVCCGHISSRNRHIVLSARPSSYCQRPRLHRLSIQQDGRLVLSEACRCAALFTCAQSACSLWEALVGHLVHAPMLSQLLKYCSCC